MQHLTTFGNQLKNNIMGCSTCSCFGKHQDPKADQDLEVIEVEESQIKSKKFIQTQENLKRSTHQLYPTVLSPSEYVRIAEGRLPPFEFDRNDGHTESFDPPEHPIIGCTYLGHKNQFDQKHGRGIII